jgi:hypothetical protein
MMSGVILASADSFSSEGKNLLRKSFLVVVSAVLFVTVLPAQNSRGSLRGTLQDATGARVASAKIVLRAVDSSLRREASSEDRGEFGLDNCSPAPTVSQ